MLQGEVEARLLRYAAFRKLGFFALCVEEGRLLREGWTRSIHKVAHPLMLRAFTLSLAKIQNAIEMNNVWGSFITLLRRRDLWRSFDDRNVQAAQPRPRSDIEILAASHRWSILGRFSVQSQVSSFLVQ